MMAPTPAPLLDWLLSSAEPWTRFRTRLDLLEVDPLAPEVQADRKAMLEHDGIQDLLNKALTWPGYPLKRHSDARHPIYTLSTLADFGFGLDDPGIKQLVDRVFQHQSPRGPFQSHLQLYKRFGGKEGVYWTWMACDAPVLLYAMLKFGPTSDPRTEKAVTHLITSGRENGWGCAASQELGNFKGPGKREDPCPLATLWALKVLALLPGQLEDKPAANGIEMLLHHWEIQTRKKYYLFGVGTDFRKFKYPFVWYNLLHVLDVLSHFPMAAKDSRYQEMVDEMQGFCDPDGKATASSMYRSWSSWSFADKKHPSPWMTFLSQRILHRSSQLQSVS